MEATTGGNSSTPPPPRPSSNAVNGGATQFLYNLPSRGNFSATTVPSSNLGGMRVYISGRDTAPPDDQLIKTDQMNILIRALLLKKQNHKNDVVKAIAKNNIQNEISGAGGSSSTRKRGAASVAEGSGRAKRAASEAEDSLQSLTVERLRAMLKEKGFSLKGKKDELIARLRSAS